MPKKLTYADVQQYFEDHGCKLLEKEYKNCDTKMKYRCDCGNISKITFNNFKQGSRCKKCGIKKQKEQRKCSFKHVYNYFREQGCELLEQEYINNNTLMEYRCDCGNVAKIRFYNFKAGNRCKECGIEKKVKKKKLSTDEVKNIFRQNNCELIGEYVNYDIKVKYICSCGNVSEIFLGNLKKGQRCKKCGNKKIMKKLTLSIDKVKKIFEDKNCKLLSDHYSYGKKLEYQCSCGNISEISLSNFKKGKRCKKCGIEKISGKNHHNYNFNLTKEDREIGRKFPEYGIWRIGVHKKDNYTCQKCSQKGGILNAHHIINYSTNKNLRLDISNGITFCEKCHKEFHKIYGTKNNNREQLDEFLKVGVLCLKSG